MRTHVVEIVRTTSAEIHEEALDDALMDRHATPAVCGGCQALQIDGYSGGGVGVEVVEGCRAVVIITAELNPDGLRRSYSSGRDIQEELVDAGCFERKWIGVVSGAEKAACGSVDLQAVSATRGALRALSNCTGTGTVTGNCPSVRAVLEVEELTGDAADIDDDVGGIGDAPLVILDGIRRANAAGDARRRRLKLDYAFRL